MSRTGVGRCRGCGNEEKLTHFDDCPFYKDRPEGLRFVPRSGSKKMDVAFIAPGRIRQVTIDKDHSPKFRGELMVCAVCGRQEQSSNDRLSQWSFYSTTDLSPWGLYYCPAEPVGVVGPHFLKEAEKERKNRTGKYQS